MRERLVTTLCGLAIVSAVSGCGYQIAVYTEHDPQAQFASLSTWDWASPRQGADQQVGDAILDGRIRAAVESELSERGFERQADAPDFLVGFRAATEDSMQAWAIDDYYGYSRPTYRFYAGRSHSYPLGTGTQRQIIYEYQQGSLILDVSTPDTRRLMWRAYARATIEPDENQETRDRRLREAVRKMLKDFPPK